MSHHISDLSMIVDSLVGHLPTSAIVMLDISLPRGVGNFLFCLILLATDIGTCVFYSIYLTYLGGEQDHSGIYLYPSDFTLWGKDVGKSKEKEPQTEQLFEVS